MKRYLLAAATLLTATPAFADSTGGDPTAGLFVIGVTLAGYFLPAIIGFGREHQHGVPILLVNLFLGWTVLGWIAALVWASMPIVKSPPGLPHAR
jgi:Superinfection immunity protein